MIYFDNQSNQFHRYLFHDCSYPHHEEQVEAIAKQLGFENISLSSKIMPMMRIVPRGYTAASDAYLTPHIRRYLEVVQPDIQPGPSLTNKTKKHLGILFRISRSTARRQRAVHAKRRRADTDGPVQRLASHPFRSGWRRGRIRAHLIRTHIRRTARHRIRHGRHVDRRQSLRRPVGARL